MPIRPSTLATRWIPLATAGIAAGALAGRWFGSRRSRPPKPRPKTWVDALGRAAIHPATLAVLKQSLLGIDRKAVLRLLGPPAASASTAGAVRAPAGDQFRAAKTWYYPLDDEKKVAMAVTFDRDRATDAAFLRDPDKPTLTDL